MRNSSGCKTSAMRALTTITTSYLLLSLTAASHLDNAPHTLVSRNLDSIVNNVAPKKPGTAGQIQCYSLPYGGIGFASHILTYWTLYWLIKGKRPFWPPSPLAKKQFDIWLTAVMLAITIGVSVWTIVRCREDWRVLVIAVWKLTMSVSLGCVCIHRSLMLVGAQSAVVTGGVGHYAGGYPAGGYQAVGDRANGSDEDRREGYNRWKLLLWLVPYGCGMVTGMAGLVSLVRHNWHNHQIQIITGVFISVVFSTALVIALLVCCSIGKLITSGFVGLFIAGSLIGILSAFYSDWILAAVMGNLVGTPSADVAALYWIYFVAKRLPLFSL
ncbi:MAG: hypothetical protein M1813_003167 [Trichoglossum hirsutum]|nr:MAG: hypothetical protein M1813_003167 [Trichoglossum hirsutum]